MSRVAAVLPADPMEEVRMTFGSMGPTAA